MRRSWGIVSLTTILTLLVGATAVATHATAVSTTMYVNIDPGLTTGSGTFEPFLDESGGVVIAGGDLEDTAFGAGLTVHVIRVLAPGDGTGTITVEQKGRITGESNGSFLGEGLWRVVSGTGAYEDLQGGGSFTVEFTPTDENDITQGGTSVEEWTGHLSGLP